MNSSQPTSLFLLLSWQAYHFILCCFMYTFWFFFSFWNQPRVIVFDFFHPRVLWFSLAASFYESTVLLEQCVVVGSWRWCQCSYNSKCNILFHFFFKLYLFTFIFFFYYNSVCCCLFWCCRHMAWTNKHIRYDVLLSCANGIRGQCTFWTFSDGSHVPYPLFSIVLIPIPVQLDEVPLNRTKTRFQSSILWNLNQ